MRWALLWASENRTLRRRLPRYRFVKRAVRKFMPGETLDDAIGAARALAAHGISATFTELGEGVTTAAEVEHVVAEYLGASDSIASGGRDLRTSAKLPPL